MRVSQETIDSIRSMLTSLDCHSIDEAVIDEIEEIEEIARDNHIIPTGRIHSQSMRDEMIHWLSLLKSNRPAQEARRIIDKLNKLLNRLEQ